MLSIAGIEAGREVQARHWVEKLTSKILRSKKPPIIIAAAITTSGSPHLGTVCEFMYPWAIKSELEKRNVETYYVFIGDIMDAFDSIPSNLTEYSSILNEHLGKPLAHVPDPKGCHNSYGHHFLWETEKLMYELEVYPEEVVPVTDLYKEGWYDDYLLFFAERLEDTKKILEEVSMRKLPRNWKNFVLPICGNCGKIATTTVLDIDLQSEEIRYRCDKRLDYTRGCGFEGYVKIKSHSWKLMWRLDWPSRQDFLGVDVEGGGVDHFTQGGSWDTAVAIHTRLFKKEPPVGYKFGFVLIKGRKMSKSKGLGGIDEIKKLIPPELVKYFLFKHELEENKNFDTRPEFLLNLYEEYKSVADIYEERGLEVDKSIQRKIYAYTLTLDRKRPWKTSFTDLLIYYQIYRDWNIVSSKIKDLKSIRRLSKYVEEWVRRSIVPENYKVEYSPRKAHSASQPVREFFKRLKPEMNDKDIHNLVYEVSEEFKENPKKVFKEIYEILLGRGYGPRLGRLIVALGIENVKRDVLS